MTQPDTQHQPATPFAVKDPVDSFLELRDGPQPPAATAPATWTFRPLGSRVVVTPVAEGERQVGNLFIPDTAKERPSMGVVVAVGPAVGAQLTPGDRVVHGKYSGHELTIDATTYIVLDVTEIMSVLLPTAGASAAQLDTELTPAQLAEGERLAAEESRTFPDADEELGGFDVVREGENHG